MEEFYFESAATILTLITVGKTLEARSKGKTTDALKGLMNLAPKTATLLRNGAEVTVPIEQVQQGDVFVVRPGAHIPVDGVVLKGSSAVNESALTGESIPVDKAEGDSVSAATLNNPAFCAAVLPAWVRIPRWLRSSRWSAMPQPPRHPLPKLQTASPVCLCRW